MANTVRYRLYKVGPYYVEVWDTLQREWESVAKLPEGELLIGLEDSGKESIARFRDAYLKKRNADPNQVVIWECS